MGGAGRNQAIMGLGDLRATVHQQEAACAIGVLGHAGRGAGLAEQSALLVARHTANRNGAAQNLGTAMAKLRGGALHLGQDAGRDIEQGQQFFVPLLTMNVVEQGARGIADIGGMDFAAT